MCDEIELKDNVDAWGVGESKNPSSAGWTEVAASSAERKKKHYSMNHPGIAHILSHELCDNGRIKPRTGTHKQAQKMAAALCVLGFIVVIHEDKKKAEIQDLIKKIAKEDHKSTSCLLIAVLSQGNLNSGMYARDDTYKLDTLWSPFIANLCPGMAGKPKWFFIQECPIERSVDAIVPRGSKRSFTDGKGDSYKIPSHADFLICHTTHGSNYMDVLCAELQEKDIAKFHILQLLTIVNGRFQFLNPDVQSAACCVTTRLTRLVQLQPREGGRIHNIQLKQAPDAHPNELVIAIPNDTLPITNQSTVVELLTVMVSQNKDISAQNREILTILRNGEAGVTRTRKVTSSWWNCCARSDEEGTDGEKKMLNNGN